MTITWQNVQGFDQSADRWNNLQQGFREGWNGGMNHVGPHMGFGLGFLNLLGTLLFFGLLLGLLLALVRAFAWRNRGGFQAAGGPSGPWTGPAGPPWMRGGGAASWSAPWSGLGRRDAALETARERLARSEITPEEYELIAKGLSPSAQDAPWAKDAALEIARLRLAKGEIGLEAFEAIARGLKHQT